MKLFYRIYKSKKENNFKSILIKSALNNQPYVKLNSDWNNTKYLCSNDHMPTKDSIKYSTTDISEAPRHDLKMIIAKKSSSKKRSIGVANEKLRLNKPNGNSSSNKVLSKDFERLRGNVDSIQFTSGSSSVVASKNDCTSEMKTTLSKKTGTVSHHDLKLENKSNTKKHNSDSHDCYEFTISEGEKEKCNFEKQQQKRESGKLTNSAGKNDEKVDKFKVVKSNLSLNIPKIKIELPSLKTKITVPKTNNDCYTISKSPSDGATRHHGDPPLKKVRFDFSNSDSPRIISSTNERCYDFDDADSNCVDQMEYAKRIGLKPVERKVESIILHRKRKKSKHSKDLDNKKPKLHVSSSLDDESLKLKLKIMGGKSSKSDKKSNHEKEETAERTSCKSKAIQCEATDLGEINVHEEKYKNRHEKAKQNVVELETHKYSVSEQKITKSDSNHPMVFIPKLILQRAQSTSEVEFKKTNSNDSKTNAPSKPISPDSSVDIKSLSDNSKLSPSTDKRPGPVDSSKDAFIKPPRCVAKMGSPSDVHAQKNYTSISPSCSPIRPNSIPASLKLSPISSSTSTVQSQKNDLQLQTQNLKRSFSLGTEKSSQPYINPYAKVDKGMFSFGPANQHFSNIPPLVQTSRNNFNFKFTNDSMTSSQSPVSITKMPNISVKDPIKLFSNACSSIEILKIPQTPQPSSFQPTVKNVKLNRPQPTTIPLEKIKQMSQIPSLQKILPIPQMSQSYIKPSSGPYTSSKSEQNPIPAYVNPYQSSGQDISLEKYALELSQDIAKLDQSLSLEKNFEHWGKLKLQEFSKINEPKSFQTPPAKSNFSQQMNMSIRNIPNPSAIMMSRNQTSLPVKPLVTFATSPKDNEITSSSEHSDIEDILSKTTITKNNEKQVTPKVNDKRNIEKLTEYLKMSAANAKAKGDDDNNNNSNASENNNSNSKNSLSLEGRADKLCSATDVICIDS